MWHDAECFITAPVFGLAFCSTASSLNVDLFNKACLSINSLTTGNGMFLLVFMCWTTRQNNDVCFMYTI